MHASFATAMARLGPFEAKPALAVAVSGGADSMALAVLADAWARGRGGTVLGLVVDHGLRADAAGEAGLTVARLSGLGIAARLLVLHGLAHGPGLAARARTARYAALTAAGAQAGILHLLLGHHAGDQAETVRMRVLGQSGPRGLAAMAALVEGDQLRLLRPLLAVPPVQLRALLAGAGIGWVEDPSNRDLATLRARLRADLADSAGDGKVVRALVNAAAVRGAARARGDAVLADVLARRVALHPAGWALLSPGPIDPEALSALLRVVAGRAYPAGRAAVARLAARPRAATLAGVRLLPAGRMGAPGDWLVVREAAAMAPPVAAVAGAWWDGRFRAGSADPTLPLGGVTLGAVGADAALLRDRTDLPDAVLRTLPALRDGVALVAVPHIDYPDAATCGRVAIGFAPAAPLRCAPFLPDRSGPPWQGCGKIRYGEWADGDARTV